MLENESAEREPLRDFVAKAIKNAIVSGRLKPGQRLIETRLATELGVSRNPVREAIRSLASEGIIDVTPRRGARVILLSRQEAQEMVEVRAALEGLNARLAARHRPAHLIDQLKAALVEGREKALSGDGSPRDFVDLNAKYHDLLAQAGSNGALRDVMRLMRERTASVFAPLSLKRAVQNWEEHAGILQAVIAGDEQLAELLASRHVLNTGTAATLQSADGEDTRPPRKPRVAKSGAKSSKRNRTVAT